MKEYYNIYNTIILLFYINIYIDNYKILFNKTQIQIFILYFIYSNSIRAIGFEPTLSVRKTPSLPLTYARFLSLLFISYLSYYPIPIQFFVFLLLFIFFIIIITIIIIITYNKNLLLINLFIHYKKKKKKQKFFFIIYYTYSFSKQI